jgi:hypothetical protein
LGLSARNAVGFGAVANVTFTPSAPPDAPTGVTAAGGNGSARVSWTAPAQNGGASIAGYVVTASPGGATAAVATPSTSAVVTGLSNGTSYTFTVAARNAGGLGASSAPSNAVTPMTVPDVPTSVSARAGNASATVSWRPPTSDGGAPISGYTVVAAPDGASATATASATTAVVEHLRNGVAYTFTVSAQNTVGKGRASDRSNSVTPKSPAPRPRIARLTPRSGAPGATVAIHGSGLSQATVVTFHSVRASFRIVSATLLKAKVPRRATTGRIAVRTRGGVATSAQVFKVLKTSPGVRRRRG